MGLFSKKLGVVFLKEEGDVTEFVEKMHFLEERAQGDLKKEIEKQIKLATYGDFGEKNIAFELKNSGIDMYVLHDIYLEAGDLSAQIDYLVITKKHIYIIECKNLIGNIEIDSNGNFIRTYELSGKRIKEGIYSPITQNQRHMLVLKEVRKSSKGNFLTKMIFEKNFEDTYKSVVVLANPKTFLNYKFAKKDVKDQVKRADQLIEHIKKIDATSNYNMKEEEMLELAQFFLSNNQPKKSDYTRKYEELLCCIDENVVNNEIINSEDSTDQKDVPEKILVSEDNLPKDEYNREEIVVRLKAFRLEQSRKEKIKPYYIFNDAQMNEIIDKRPESKESLIKIHGFGQSKVEKYGDIILGILN